MKKTIVVTGASNGVGYHTSRCLVAKGHRVLALSRNWDALQELQLACQDLSDSGELSIHRFDLGNKSSMDELRQKMEVELIHINALINNAGFLATLPFEESDPDDNLVRQMFEVNFFGPVRWVHILLPFFDSGARSHIVNIGSMGGYQGSAKFAGLSYYSASKGAMAVMTECLAEELSEKNIAVNCLALGAVQTDMLAKAFPGYKAPVTPEEMGEFVADFTLTGQTWFNGKILPASLSTP